MSTNLNQLGTTDPVLTPSDITGVAQETTLQGVAADVAAIKTDVAALVSRQCEIVVTCVTQDDVTVTGQTVTLRAGSSAEAEIYDTRAYNGQPVTFQVPQGFRYFVEVSANLQGHFAPTTATGTATTSTTAVTLTYSDISHITTYADIKGAMDSITSQAEGRAALVGIEISDTWVSDDGITTYNDPMIVVDVQPVLDPSGAEHLAALLMRKYCTKNYMPFDAPENGIEAYANEATAQQGIYYFGYGKDYAQATTYNVNAFCGYKGGIWKCTTAVTGQEAFDENKWNLLDAKWYSASATYNVGDYAKYGRSVYKCTTQISTAEDFDGDHWTQVLSSASFQENAITALNLSSGTTMPYSAWALILKNDINNSLILRRGYNKWVFSNWRQNLNSDESIGLWWASQHVGDCPPTELAVTRGYKAGCSAQLLQYVKPIRVLNGVGPTAYTVDLFFAPSVTQMYGVGSLGEGEAFKKVVDNCISLSGWNTASNGYTTARAYKAVDYQSNAYRLWTRSAYSGNVYTVAWVNSGGEIDNTYKHDSGNAGTNNRTIVCCAIY